MGASKYQGRTPQTMWYQLMLFVSSYYILHIASILLVLKIRKQKSVYGVSLDY